MLVILGSVQVLKILFSTFIALVFLVFTLLYTPCIAAVATVRRELGWVWHCLLLSSSAVLHG